MDVRDTSSCQALCGRATLALFLLCEARALEHVIADAGTPLLPVGSPCPLRVTQAGNFKSSSIVRNYPARPSPSPSQVWTLAGPGARPRVGASDSDSDSDSDSEDRVL